ncbi:homoserine dehydrogenase [Parasporobacterium paucivorans]|uniref:Homoserine dehydrogenase n=1 Tax=Parasporobacterium paucivorans DSM 15970 TaxID=1122934 RepID=A0A1M6KQZ7_9FIRM|nr:homoserine dehydrogenase [Parasporobacterium paucivorans]SHJ61357.1 homoserine dehydrogenase [Parasporobacterium paucivorans DSM 15970]
MINIAVLGYGTVGSGIIEVLNTNGDSINKKAGEEINVKYVLDLRDFPGDPVQDKIVHDFNVILSDPEIEIIAEVMGGAEPAYTFVKAALQHKKSVCTSNKELVAKYGPELLEIARQNKRNFLFEASVGGGIPIIRPLNQSLTADEITKITGVLNGTSNYILTKMSKEGMEFKDALKQAQEFGYAERNPDADILGYDSTRKIAILASLAFGMSADYEDIYTEGITKITDKDFLYANSMGLSIKLFAKAEKVDSKFYAMVAPAMIDDNHPLHSVNGVFNGILVNGNVIGDVMFYGSGAGKLPTASAVVADIVDAVKHLNVNIMSHWSSKKLEFTDIRQSKKQFFVRIKGLAKDKLAEVEKAFGKVQLVELDELKDEFGFITSIMTEEAFEEAQNETQGIITRIRIEG